MLLVFSQSVAVVLAELAPGKLLLTVTACDPHGLAGVLEVRPELLKVVELLAAIAAFLVERTVLLDVLLKS